MAFKMQFSGFKDSPIKNGDDKVIPGGHIDRINKQDAKNILENTNVTLDRETNKSIRRQNRKRIDKLSRKEVKKELKDQKIQGKNPRESMDTSWWKRNFGTTKSLKTDLRRQQYHSEQHPVGHYKTYERSKGNKI